MVKQLITSLFLAPLLCWNLSAQAQQTTFSISPSTVSPAVGDVVHLNIVVTNFDSIVDFQYTMEWDATLFQFVSVDSTILPNTSGTWYNPVGNNAITFSWNAPASPGYYSIPAGQRIYRLNLKVLAASTNYWAKFSGSQTSVEVIKNPGTNINPIFQNLGTPPGKSTGDLGVSTPSNTVGSGQKICIDITASNFTSIVSAQWAMKWDSSVLKFDSVSVFNTTLPLDASNFGTSQAATNGVIYFSWNAPSGSRSLADGSVLYRLCFHAIGAGGTSTQVKFVSTIDVIRTTPAGDVSINLNASNGTQTISGGSSGSGLNFYGTNVSGKTGDVVCVKVNTVHFTNIATASWSMHWDSTKYSYNKVQALNPQLLGLDASSFNNLPSGSLRFVWASSTGNGVTLTDSTEMYEVCLNILPAAVPIACSPLHFDGIPVKAQVNDGTAGNAKVPFTFSDACITVTASSAPITYTAASTNPACAGAATGGVTLTAVAGGNGTFTYSWTGPNGFVATTQNISNLNAGTYNLTVTSGAVTKTDVFTLTQPAAIAIGVPTVVNPVCAGQTGSIAVSPTGGTGAYTYSWNSTPVQTTSTASGLTAGSYTVTVKDAAQCSATSPAIAITQPTAIAIGTPTIVNSSCGGSTGSIAVSPTGGTGAYTYSWNSTPVQTTSTASGLTAGSYTVTVKDAAQCSATSPAIAITQPTAIAIGTPTIVNSSCGGSTGSIAVSPTGGTGAYTYSWNTTPIQTTATATGLAAGSYTVTVKDAAQCSATSPAIAITQPTAIAIGTPTIVNSSCGGSTGSIAVSPTGGTGAYTYSWNTTPVQTTATATGLAAGSYTVIVKDAAQCLVVSPAFTVTQPTAITIGTPTVVNPVCAGQPGSITVAPTGGSGTYMYTWNTTPVQTTATATGLPAGSYTVTVKDGGQCSAISQPITITQPAAIAIGAPAITNVNCFGQSTGSIALTASGGTGALTYSWNTSPVQTTAAASNLSAGAYTVTVKDANQCMVSSAAINVSQPASGLSYGLSAVTNASCKGGPGAIALSVSGGTTPYTFSWSGPGGFTATTQSIGGPAVKAGNYVVTTTDAKGCALSSSPISVTEPAAIVIAAPQIVNTQCGKAVGSINISASGGVGTLSYQWAGPNGFTSGSQNIANLKAGAYTVSVTDANQCVVVSSPVNVNDGNSNISLPSVVVKAVSCNGSSDGSITVAGAGGNPPLSYAWTGPNGFTTTGAAITGLKSGDYVVAVTDNIGCSFVSNAITVAQPAVIAVVPQVTNIQCNGGSSGAITVTTMGGTGPYTYSWTGPNGFTATGPSIANLKAGAYIVAVKDAANCIANPNPVNVNQSSSFVLTPQVVSNVLCKGGATGEIDLTVTGATAPVTYAWSGPGGFTASSQNITNRPAGAYTVTVTDASACPASASATITEPAVALNIPTPTVVNAFCFGTATGSITVSPSAGTAPYIYTWAGPNGALAATTATINNLAAGDYVVAVTDANQCKASSGAIKVTQPSASLSVTGVVVDANGASNGTITTTVSGGTAPFTYLWAGQGVTSGAANQTSLLPGTYSVTVQDAGKCTGTQTFTVGGRGSSAMAITNPLIRPAGCSTQNKGAISVTLSGGKAPYTFAWSGPNGFTSSAQNITNLFGGSYSLTVTDSVLQVVNSPVYVVTSSATGVVVQSTSIISDSCNGKTGSISINATGGTGIYSYQWNDIPGNVKDRTGLSKGTYQVTATDDNGCSGAAAPFTVDYKPCQLFVAQVNANPKCYGGSDGSIALIISGGNPTYSIKWNNGGSGIVNNTPTIGGAFNITGLTAGAYSVSVTDNNNQVVTVNATLSQPDSIKITPTVTPDDGSCGKGSIILSVSGGAPQYRYVWNTGESARDRLQLCAGNYSVTVSDVNQCANASIILVGLSSKDFKIDSAATKVTNSECANGAAASGSIELSVTGGASPYTYIWKDAQGTTIGTTPKIIGLKPGRYTVTVTDNSRPNKTDSRYFDIKSTSTLAVNDLSVGNSESGNCSGSATVVVTGGNSPYNFLWCNSVVTSTNTISKLCAGACAVTVTDASGCQVIRSFIIDTGSNVRVTIIKKYAGNFDIQCNAGANGSATVESVRGGTGPYAYIWSSGETTRTAFQLTAGPAFVTVTDLSNGRRYVGSTQLFGPDKLSATTLVKPATGSHIADGEATVFPTGGVAPYKYKWNSAAGDTTKVATGLLCGNSGTPASYFVLVQDAQGCSVIANALVPCADNAGIPCLQGSSVVTPNQDGKNDVFALHRCGTSTVQLEIFNRWGQLVYKNQNYDVDSWEGQDNGGNQLPEGAYFYVAKAQGTADVVKGSFALIRGN